MDDGTFRRVVGLDIDYRCYSTYGKAHSQTDDCNHEYTLAACPPRNGNSVSGEAALHTWVQRSQDWDWKDRSFRSRSLFTAALRSTGRTSGAAHAHKRLGRDHHPSPAAQLDASSNDDAQPHDPTEGIIVHEVGAWADMSELLTDGCNPPPPSGGGGGSGDSEDPHHLSVDMGNGISVTTFGTFSEAKDFANDEGRGGYVRTEEGEDPNRGR